MKRTSPSSRAIIERGECSVGRVCLHPLVLLDQVVQLDEVDVVDAEARERAFELHPRREPVPLASLCREEVLVPAADEPRGDAQLGIPVACRRVEVVHAVLAQHIEYGVSCVLADIPERRTAEHDPRARVSRPPEVRVLDHGASLWPSPDQGRPGMPGVCRSLAPWG